MASGSVLIVDLEDPYIDIQVVDYEPGKGQLELTLVLDVVGAHGYRNVTQLEDALGAALSGVDDVSCGDVRLSAQDWRP